MTRSTLAYQGRKAAKDAPVVTRMKEPSARYSRYGYRRIRIFLGRDGYRMSPGRAHRLWRTAGLKVPRKRKRLATARPRPQAPCGPNQVWSYDFVFDHCANGRQLKCLTVTEEFTKEGLAMVSTAAFVPPCERALNSPHLWAANFPEFHRGG